MHVLFAVSVPELKHACCLISCFSSGFCLLFFLVKAESFTHFVRCDVGILFTVQGGYALYSSLFCALWQMVLLYHFFGLVGE